MSGNVLDMAIGVIIGGAFGKIVSSLVSDVLMPPLGPLMGKVDFPSLFINMSNTPHHPWWRRKRPPPRRLITGSFCKASLTFASLPSSSSCWSNR